MNFSCHLEFIFHLTCKSCKFYWTYATMEKNFQIEKFKFFCPNCGEKGTINYEGKLNE